MSSNTDIKQHISISERAKWNKVIQDFNTHLGSTGINNHPLGNGTQPGFSTNDYTTQEKNKLAGIAEGSNKYVHPQSHDPSIIPELKPIATSGDWKDLINIPARVVNVVNGTADSATVSNGIRITIGPNAPSNPIINKELWIDTTNLVMKIRINNSSWQIVGAAYR